MMPSRLKHGLPFLLMPGTQRLDDFTQLIVKAFGKDLCVDHFTALRAPNELVRDDFVPSILKHVLELNGVLRAYSPAGGAPGASGHVVKQSLDSIGLF
jgi:hypothetical protein